MNCSVLLPSLICNGYNAMLCILRIHANTQCNEFGKQQEIDKIDSNKKKGERQYRSCYLTIPLVWQASQSANSQIKQNEHIHCWFSHELAFSQTQQMFFYCALLLQGFWWREYMKSNSKQQQIDVTKIKTTKEDRIKYPPSPVEHPNFNEKNKQINSIGEKKNVPSPFLISFNSQCKYSLKGEHQ